MATNPEIARELISRTLNMKIDHVDLIDAEVSTENILRKNVRYDVYAEADGKAFDIEIQTVDDPYMQNRMRYYRAQMDVRLLDRGDDYIDLVPSYVIFICTFDMFGRGLPVYEFKNICTQDKDLILYKNCKDVVLNAEGDLTKTTPELAILLQFLKTNIPQDEFTKDIQKAVDIAYRDEEWSRAMWTYEKEIALRERVSFEEGEAREQSRERTLIAAMKSQGLDDPEILKFLTDSDRKSVYERFNIE